MLQIESFWKGLPENPIFYNQDKYGYGLVHKDKSKRRNSGYDIRKVTRQLRRRGWDDTEIWNLDYTIQEYLSDTYGGFWKLCGTQDDWADYDLDGNKVDFQWNNPDYFKSRCEWENTRTKSYLAHLKDFLDNLEPAEFKKFADFCAPRLLKLSKITHGWPGGDEFPKYEDWTKELKNMADCFNRGTYSPYFVSHFFHLWD